MTEYNETESHYPVCKSCSFLAINYYEEASNKFEEYLSDALIPECSYLLNDADYPLYCIDEFYWTPWKSAEYDADFLLKEKNKLEEKLLTISSNVSIFTEPENIISTDECPDSDSLFDTEKFKEIKLQDLCDSSDFLEVPFAPSSVLELKHDISLSELLREVSPMESENIFEKKHTLYFESLETHLDFNSLVTEDETLMDDFEKFEEITFIKMPDEDLTLENLSANYKNRDPSSQSGSRLFHKNTDSSNSNREFTNFNFNKKRNLSSDDTSPFSPPPKVTKCSNSSKTFEKKFIHSTGSAGNNFISSQKENYDPLAKFNESNSNCKLDLEMAERKKLDSSHKLNAIPDRKYDNNYESSSELYDDEFFSENFVDFENVRLDAYDQQIISDSVILDVNEISSGNHNYSEKPDGSSDVRSDDNKSFLEKLSKLDLAKTGELIDMGDYQPKKCSVNSEKSFTGTTSFRSQPCWSKEKPSKVDEAMRQVSFYDKDVKCTQNSYKTKNSSFDLLSSFLCAARRDGHEIGSLKSSFSCSQINRDSFDENDNLEIFKIMKNGHSSFKENLILSTETEENRPKLLHEDVTVKLPDDYVSLILMYETAATYYVQKLIPWEGFDLSQDLTVMDIPLDKTRFLLNQEVKNCRDRSINPLQGGIHYSHYIQLLIFHGILKSLNSLIHFGANLAISCLYDYEKKHAGVLKGCFNDLIEEVSTFIQKTSKTISVHPKIERMCTYLQEKYYFCKDNVIPFNVLIILKEHITFFYSEFEAAMKVILPEMIIELIPESCFLEQETAKFSGKKEHIYIACLSSISKSIHWKGLTLFIEYDTDCSFNWKDVCSKENVAHISFKVEVPPLKKINDIKHTSYAKEPLCVKPLMPVESKPVPVIISDALSSEYDLQDLLNEKQDLVICTRAYKKYLPDVHFADITVDYKTSVVVVHFTALSNHFIVESLIDRIFYLHLKYEICWIIVHDNVTIKNIDKDCLSKIKENYFRFYYMASTMKTTQSFKLKFLYAYEDTDVTKWINAILSKSLKYNLLKSEYCPISNFPTNVSAEELFLVSFPSLNPYVVHAMLSAKMSISQLMSSKLEDLCNKLQCVPKRFLTNFHSLIHERVNLFSSPSEEIHENVFTNAMKSDRISRNSTSNPCPQKLSSISEELVEFTNCLEKFHSPGEKAVFDCFFENPDDISQSSEATAPDNYSDMSLEEIDRNYRALQARDMEYAAFENNLDVSSTQSCTSNSVSSTEDFSCKSIFSSPQKSLKVDSSLVSKSDISYRYVKESQTLTAKKQVKSRQTYQAPTYPVKHGLILNCSSPEENGCNDSLHYGNEVLNSQKSQCPKYPLKHGLAFKCSSPEKNRFNNSLRCENEVLNSQTSQRPKYPLKNVSAFKCGPPGENGYSLHSGYEGLNSQASQLGQLNLSQYKFKKKRQASGDVSSKSKYMKYSPQRSSILLSSPRIRKGQSSRTVCKQVRFENVSPCQSSGEHFLPSSDETFQSSPGSGEAFQTVEDYSKKLDSTGFNCNDFSWLSQNKLTLTPRTSQKLSYEKMPGKKGQTRLIFH